MQRKTPTRLSTTETIKLHIFLKENKEQFKGLSATKLVELAEKELGRTISTSTVYTIGKDIGYTFNMTKKQNTKVIKILQALCVEILGEDHKITKEAMDLSSK